MSDTKMLQSILDTVVDIKKDIKTLNEKVDGVEFRLTKRIDTLGKGLAYLEDDAPTREEHNKLEKRVRKIEKKLVLS